MNKNGKPLGVLLEDDGYCLQESIHGRDLKISADPGIIAVQDVRQEDRRDVLHILPQSVLDDVRALSFRNFGLVGTLAGDKFYATDIVYLDGEDITDATFDSRYYMLKDLLEDNEPILNGSIEIIPAFFDLEMKEEKLAAIRARNGHGVVFRNMKDDTQHVFELEQPAPAAVKQPRKRQP